MKRQQRQDDHRSTVEILRDAHKDSSRTVEVAEDTSRSLAVQGEQIDRMGRKVDKIEEELTVSDKILKTMTGFSGMVTSLFSSKKEQRPSDRPTSAAPKASPLPAPAGAAPNRDRASRDERNAVGTVTQEEDDLLDGISADLQAVRNLARQQNSAIRHQNERLDELNEKTQRTNDHMQRTRGRINRIS